MREAVIVSAVRTPLGSFNGSLSGVGATKLGGIVIEEAIRRAGIAKEAVNEVIMGSGAVVWLRPESGQAGRGRSRYAMGNRGPLRSNKVCGSGLKAVMLAAQAVQTGDAEVVVAGGMENMSMAPYPWKKRAAAIAWAMASCSITWFTTVCGT